MSAALLTCVVLASRCATESSSNQPRPVVDQHVQQQAAKSAAQQATAIGAADSKNADAPFQDEPAAHAIYDQMVEAMDKANSLSFTSHLQWEKQDGTWQGDCIYRAWLKKPNYFRIETEVASKDTNAAPEIGGILIGDGHTQWIYWPQGRSRWPFDDPKVYEKTRLTSYMKQPAPPGEHSIGHDIRRLVDGMSWTVIDLSMFHGRHTDSLLSNIESVCGLGTETIGGEDCDKIEVSISQYQRTWYLWVSKTDHLPRKLKDIRRVSPEIVVTEDWSSVALNADVPNTLFAWKPPESWTEWQIPPADERLLKPGVRAPDFELASLDGASIKLSNYHGQVVWLCFWYAGCPPCRVEMPHLQATYGRYKDKGLVVLGFNSVDDKEIVSEFLEQTGVTFPMILDTSDAARRVCQQEYQPPGTEVYPLNYIIDRNGNIVCGWSGDKRSEAMAVLVKLGGELGDAIRRDQDAKALKSTKQ